MHQWGHDTDRFNPDLTPDPNFHTEKHIVYWEDIEFRVEVSTRILKEIPETMDDPGETVTDDTSIIESIECPDMKWNIIQFLIETTNLIEYIQDITCAEYDESVTNLLGF